MIALAFELPLEIGEVTCRGVEPLGEDPSERIGNLRIRFEEARSVLDHEGADRRGCPYRRGMRPVEQHGHLAEHGACLVDYGHLRIAAQHLDAALSQDIEPARRLPLQEDRARRVLPWRARASL